MKIEPIIYETTRFVDRLEDKLSIATLVLFSWKLGNKTFCELLYTKNLEDFIFNLSQEYKEYDIQLEVRLQDMQIKEALVKTIEKVRKKYDSYGFLKALYEGDEYAIIVDEIVNYKFEIPDFKNFAKKLEEQLKITF